MIDRRLLLLGGAALLGYGAIRWFDASNVEAAGTFEIQKTDSEWRGLLTKAQYEVLRLHRTEVPGSSPLNLEKRKGTFSCAGCDAAAVRVRDQVRERHRLAELLSAAAEMPSAPAPTTRCSFRAPRCTAPAAAGISATCSPTGRRRPGSATA